MVDQKPVEPGELLSEHRAAYKQPGLTLAESLGLDIPASAPGGNPIGMPMSFEGVGASERARRHQDLRDEGFYDHDAFGKAV
jgi:hypothetical protein